MSEESVTVQIEIKCAYYCHKTISVGAEAMSFSENKFVCLECYQIILDEIRLKENVEHYRRQLESAERGVKMYSNGLENATKKLNEMKEKNKSLYGLSET